MKPRKVNLGLNATGRVLEALVKAGTVEDATTSSIGDASDVSRNQAHEILGLLVDSGIVEKVPVTDPQATYAQTYNQITPDGAAKLYEDLAVLRDRIDGILSHLEAQHPSRTSF